MASPQVIKGLVLRSSLNLKSISNSSKIFASGLQKASVYARDISENLQKANETKKKLIVNDQTFFKRRRNAVIRKERESIIEASGVSGAVRRTGNIISESTKGFFGRVLDAAGAVLVGFLVTKLPEIIKGAVGLMKRIQQLVNALRKWLNGGIFGLFTQTELQTKLEKDKVASANINLQQQRNQLDDAKDNLSQSLDKINSQVDQGVDELSGVVDEMDKKKDKEDKEKDKDKKPGLFGGLIESINPISRIRGMMNRRDDEEEDEEDKPKEEEVDAKKTVQPQEQLIPNKNKQKEEKEEENDRGPDVRGLDGEELSPEIEAEQEDALDQSGFEMYEEGTPRVPKDGLAFLHKDEAVIPKKSVDRYGADFINRIIENKEEDNATKLKAARELMEKLVGQFKEDNNGTITVDEFDAIKEQTLGKLKKSFKGLTKEITESVSTEANQDLLQAMKPTKDMMKNLAKELNVARKSSTIFMVNNSGGNSNPAPSASSSATSSKKSKTIVIDSSRDMYRRMASTLYAYT